LDQDLQLVGSDPSGGPYNTGLRVPATAAQGDIPANRYMMMLAMARFNANQKARLVGIRQLVTIGAYIPSNSEDPTACTYPLELEVTSSMWHFVDANITWYLQRIPPMKFYTSSNSNTDGEIKLYSPTPALLFQNAIGDAGGYVPPNGGIPYGTPLISGLSALHDLRFGWRSNQAWDSIDIEIEGPCDIALFASIQQTDPETRCGLVLPEGLTSADLPPEDRFVYNFPDAVYWRVAGSLIFQEEEYYKEPRGLQEDCYVR
jgi:hypothetical protein